jgi:hypothetical protein
LNILEKSLNLEKFEKGFKFKSLKRYEKRKKKLSKPSFFSLPFSFSSPTHIFSFSPRGPAWPKSPRGPPQPAQPHRRQPEAHLSSPPLSLPA